jgi:hypothetical protein
MYALVKYASLFNFTLVRVSQPAGSGCSALLQCQCARFHAASTNNLAGPSRVVTKSVLAAAAAAAAAAVVVVAVVVVVTARLSSKALSADRHSLNAKETRANRIYAGTLLFKLIMVIQVF